MGLGWYQRFGQFWRGLTSALQSYFIALALLATGGVIIFLKGIVTLDPAAVGAGIAFMAVPALIWWLLLSARRYRRARSTGEGADTSSDQNRTDGA